MNTVTKSLIARWSFIVLFGLVFSLPTFAHGYGGGYWRPHGYYGWQRPYYPPPAIYVPGPRFVPVPPPVVYGAPPIWRASPPPVWLHPHRYGWR